MVFLILIGASIFSLVFRGFGGDEVVAELLNNLPGGKVGAMIAVMLLMFLLGCILASTLIRKIYPSAEAGLLIVVAVMLPVTFWLIWRNLRDHLRSVGLLSNRLEMRCLTTCCVPQSHTLITALAVS